MESLALRKIKVLVVDDEHSIADTLHEILRRQGFDVAIAYSGRMAVEAARLWKPDVLLSDVVMPEMNGVEAAICIRAAHPQCRILLFSGHSVTAVATEAALLALNVSEVIPKPIHPTDLIQKIRSVVSPDLPAAEIAS
jgi:CheY-like chemotaxis protein